MAAKAQEQMRLPTDRAAATSAPTASLAPIACGRDPRPLVDGSVERHTTKPRYPRRIKIFISHQ